MFLNRFFDFKLNLLITGKYVSYFFLVSFLNQEGSILKIFRD